MFVFGDIEEREDLLQDVVECVKRNRGKGSYFVFLGDIYTPKCPSKSIANIKKILEVLQHPFQDFISNVRTLVESGQKYEAVEEIKTLFHGIYKDLRISRYNTTNKFKSSSRFTADPELDKYPEKQEFVFLLGNKEVDLIRDLTNIQFGAFLFDKFKTIFSYYYKHIKHETEISFTLDELNTLLNYFSISRNYIIYEDILLTHMYVNAKILINKSTSLSFIRKVVSGHNRCYGIYYDSNMPFLTIHMLDLTHENPMLRIRNFIRINGNTVEYITENETIREMLKIKLPANDFFLKGVIDETNDIPSLEYYLRCRERAQFQE